MTGPLSISAALVDSIYRSAALMQREGRYVEAEAEYVRLLHYFPDSAALHYNIGLLLYAQDKFEASLEHYLQAMDEAGDDPDLLYNLGLCLQKCGRTGNAALVYEQLTRHAPDDVDGLYNLAGCYRELCRYDQAAEVLDRLLVLQPDHQAATGGLAYLLHLQGKLDEACRTYCRLLELHPGHQTARHMVAALRGEDIGTAADEYVRAVFNGYAEGFEDSLVQGLGYEVPQGLRRGVDLLAGAGRNRDRKRHALPVLARVDRDHVGNRNHQRMCHATEAPLEADVLVCHLQLAGRVRRQVKHDLAVAGVARRDAGVLIHQGGEVGRVALIHTPLPDRTQQVRLGRDSAHRVSGGRAAPMRAIHGLFAVGWVSAA
jgi:Flp pilus assembly protein TadD